MISIAVSSAGAAGPGRLTTTLGHYGGRSAKAWTSRVDPSLHQTDCVQSQERNSEHERAHKLGFDSGSDRHTTSTCRTLLHEIQWCEIMLQSPCGVPETRLFSIESGRKAYTMLGSRRTNRGVFMHSPVCRPQRR